LFAACAIAEPLPASKEEKRAVMASYSDCLHTNARKLDDHRSDASTIALSLRSVCAKEFFKLMDVFGRHLDPVERLILAKEGEENFMRHAIETVLRERAGR